MSENPHLVIRIKKHGENKYHAELYLPGEDDYCLEFGMGKTVEEAKLDLAQLLADTAKNYLLSVNRILKEFSNVEKT